MASDISSEGKIIFMDIDGVISDTNAGLSIYRSRNGLPPLELGHNYAWDHLSAEDKEYVFECYRQAEFYRLCPPILHAASILRILSYYWKFQIKYITSRGSGGPIDRGEVNPAVQEATFEWLETHRFPQGEIVSVHSPQKIDHALNYPLSSLAFIVEDHPETARQFCYHGVRTFLIDARYNRNLDWMSSLLQRITDLRDLLPYVRSVYAFPGSN